MADAIIGKVKAVITADTAQLDSGLRRATANLANFGDGAIGVGKKLTKNLTLPIAAVGGAALKMAADFEKSMASIVGLVGVAADEVKAMEGSVRSMATQFGSSATQAADALFFITSAGLRGSDATNTLAASLKASAVGLGDVSTIADLATSALNAYGADTLSATQATDVLTAAVREGKLEASQLAGSMGGVLPIASAMGVQFHEVGAAFAALSRTGTNAAEAATQINGILSALLKPTQQAEDALRTMGLSSEFLRQNLKDNGLLDTLQMLSAEFDGNAAATASVFGNVRALKGVMDLMGANVAGTEAIFSSMADTTGTVDKAFGVMAETTSFKFNQAVAEAKDGMLELGQQVMPMATDAIETIAGVIGNITDVFAGMSDGTKQAVVSLGGMLAIAGPLALGIGMVSKALVALRAANPWILGLSAAFAGLSMALGVFYQDAREAEERAKALRDEFAAAGEPIDNLIPKLQQLAGEIKNLLPPEAADRFEEQIERITGSATLLGELEAADIDTSFLDAIGVSVDELVNYVRGGTEAADDFTTALERFAALDGAAGRTLTLDEVMAGLGRNLNDTEQSIVDFVMANEDSIAVAGQLVDALGKVNKAFGDVIKENEDAAESYINSGEVFSDLAGTLSEEYVRSLLASGEAAAEAAGRTDVHTAALENVQAALQLERDALNEVAATAFDAEAMLSLLEVAQTQAAMSANDMARTLVDAGEAAGYDKRQVADLARQLGILDQIDPSVMVELGLDVVGIDALTAAVDAIILAKEIEYNALVSSTGLALDRVDPALASLRELRQALLDVGDADSGGGGGGGSAAPIDEVARAAEEAQMAVDRFAGSVQRLGDGLVGRDFAEKLLGSSPEQIVEEFRSIANEAMAVAEAAENLGLPGGPQFLQQIADIGDAFDELAAKAAEVAEAQKELAAAQGVLVSLRSELSALEDRYAEWQAETDGVTTAQERLNEALEASAAAADAFDDATRALERMTEAQQEFLASSGLTDGNQSISDRLAEELEGFREAQRELDQLKNDRQSFESGVRDMFNVRLSPDTNVMGQTQRIVAQARELRDNLTALKDRGFPADVLQQVAQAGLAGGAKLSRHLLRLSQGDLAEFLAMRAEISGIGAQVATVAGEVIFGADVAGAEDRLNEQRSLVAGLYQDAVAEARQLQEEARLAMDVQRAAVEAAFEAAIAEAQQKVEAQEQIVSNLETALETAGQEMADLTYAIQNDLATAFNNFLTGLGSRITTLTTTPALIDVNVSPTESLSTIVSSLETLVEQAAAGSAIGVGASPGGGGGGDGSAARTYTVANGDSLWGIAQSLLGSGTRWREIARANGHDPAGYGSSWAIRAGDVLQIPARAMGGPVSGRKPYLVGEMGPELFVPGMSGAIVPNHAFGGGGDTYNITVNMPTGVDGEDVVKAIEKYTRRRGAVAMPTTNRRRF